MHKRKTIIALLMCLLALGATGCSIIGTAIGAGITYGIYQATKK